MERTVVSDIWRCASASDTEGFADALSELLDGYRRMPGKDELVRITPECIGLDAYRSQLAALSAKSRWHVSFYDYGWHIELRTRLFVYLSRSLQRFLVHSGSATPIICEDLLAHDIGV